ncbi:maleylpyruvate isomerase family mycothiol-dependent enzyme [uncultured Friedmanniella sp.]|uniref:maleylpyruvate isomerase family mycothiol-dependent enzyme n=1 Tax=uncultured Friedmanniella sp. TaxID=335381 RepID=UPI0035CBF177
MSPDLDRLWHLGVESARFRAVLQDAAPDARVPTCPDWDVADLVWHLTEVQYFWAAVVRQQQTDLDRVDTENLTRPVKYRELLRLSDRCTRDLVAVLRRTPPGTPVWTWAEDQSAGFVLRRQAHEALIHRVDAECVTDERSGMDPTLAADGVDEALRVMFGGAPSWAELTVDEHAAVRVTCTDTGHAWHVSLARYAGTDEEGTDQAGGTLQIALLDPGTPTAAHVSAAAADLDCWLWGRPPPGEVNLSGDVAVLAGLREVVSAGVQ